MWIEQTNDLQVCKNGGVMPHHFLCSYKAYATQNSEVASLSIAKSG